MDFFETVAKRGSYRNAFLPEAVPQTDLDKILLAGVAAPSGYNHQTTSFVVVTDANLKKSIAERMPTPATLSAPVFLVPISTYWEAENGLHFEMEDYAAATENVMLAITALGYAGVWMDGKMKLDDNAEMLEKLLHVPAGWHVRAVIPFGRPAQPVTQKEKKPLAERVFYNTCE